MVAGAPCLKVKVGIVKVGVVKGGWVAGPFKKVWRDLVLNVFLRVAGLPRPFPGRAFFLLY